MPVLAGIVAWSNDSFGHACEILHTDEGCLVQLTLDGFSSLEQHCSSVPEALEIATEWRERFDQAPQAA